MKGLFQFCPPFVPEIYMVNIFLPANGGPGDKIYGVLPLESRNTP